MPDKKECRRVELCCIQILATWPTRGQVQSLTTFMFAPLHQLWKRNHRIQQSDAIRYIVQGRCNAAITQSWFWK